MTNEELYFTIDAIRQVQANYTEWSKDYIYNNKTNEFRNHKEPEDKTVIVADWFNLEK
jgi:hypothetical protein